MEEKIFEFLSGFLSHWGYYALFITTFLEASALLGLLVPGETMVIIAGAAASKGVLDIQDVIWVSMLGAVTGDSSGYFLGSRFGDSLLSGGCAVLRKERLEGAKGTFLRHGGKTVFLGRFVSVARAFAPIVAGMTRMSYPRFLAYNVSGGALWAVTFSALGFLAGSAWPSISPYLHGLAKLSWIMAAASVLAYLLIRAVKSGVMLRNAVRLDEKIASRMPRAWGLLKGRFEA